MNDFKLMMAPLENITGPSFRTICYNHGADMTFTEMVRINALARNNKSTIFKTLPKDNTPVIIQLLGSKEEYYRKYLDSFKPFDGFKGFNLNLGCPSSNVTKINLGAGMVGKITKTVNVVNLIKEYGYSVSIKMRLGLNFEEKQYKVYLKSINSTDADFYIVHARHGMQSSSLPVDFSVYEECADTGKTIIANGDINSKQQIEELKEIGIKGAMIGRAALKDPSIFDKLKGKKGSPIETIMQEYRQLSMKYGEPEKYTRNVLRLMDVYEIPNKRTKG